MMALMAYLPPLPSRTRRIDPCSPTTCLPPTSVRRSKGTSCLPSASCQCKSRTRTSRRLDLRHAPQLLRVAPARNPVAVALEVWRGQPAGHSLAALHAVPVDRAGVLLWLGGARRLVHARGE